MFAWLTSLYSEISPEVVSLARANLSAKCYKATHREFARTLTPDELDSLCKIACNFVVEPQSDIIGYRHFFGVLLYVPPPYPEVPPEFIFKITAQYLPPGVCNTFDDSWAILSPLSHNNSNVQLLEYYGMGTPREKDWYQ